MSLDTQQRHDEDFFFRAITSSNRNTDVTTRILISYIYFSFFPGRWQVWLQQSKQWMMMFNRFRPRFWIAYPSFRLSFVHSFVRHLFRIFLIFLRQLCIFRFGFLCFLYFLIFTPQLCIFRFRFLCFLCRILPNL